MSKFVGAFPQLRIVIYSVVTAILGSLVIAGVVTEGQSNNILSYVGMALGALASLLAVMNVDKTKPVSGSVEQVVVSSPADVAASVQARFEQAQRDFAPSVDGVRAEVERVLGQRPR